MTLLRVPAGRAWLGPRPAARGTGSGTSLAPPHPLHAPPKLARAGRAGTAAALLAPHPVPPGLGLGGGVGLGWRAEAELASLLAQGRRRLPERPIMDPKNPGLVLAFLAALTSSSSPTDVRSALAGVTAPRPLAGGFAATTVFTGYSSGLARAPPPFRTKHLGKKKSQAWREDNGWQLAAASVARGRCVGGNAYCARESSTVVV